jgi:23S rRNA pseudouridine1911/1915/1917 synthase
MPSLTPPDPEFARTVTAEREVGFEYAGLRVDRVAAALWPDHSRTQLGAWIRDGRLTVDGRRVPPKHRVTGGERLMLNAVIDEPATIHRPQPVDFAVVYEDEHLLVVDKPAGLVVHPGAGNPDRTLVNGLLALRPVLAALPRGGIVHRLDKDTSGLMVVAATAVAQRALAAAIAARRVERGYLAVVEGVLTGGRDIEAPIGRDPHNRLRQRVLDDGRYALTHVRVRERFRAHSLIDARLATGRTHQIRVHMSAVGHPLVGDRRYGAPGRLPAAPLPVLVPAVQQFTRQALHAAGLAFVHPVTDAALSFESALPDDIETLLALLREDRDGA